MATTTLRIFGLAAVIALLQLVPADPALSSQNKAEPATSNQTLGAVSGVIDFCARVDHRGGAQKYDKLVGRLLPGVSDKDFRKARNTDEYRAAYRAVSIALRELSDDDARNNCAAL